MEAIQKHGKLDVGDLRWKQDPTAFTFKTTDELEPLDEIIGQDRGVDAFRFGIGIDKPGYNILVTGQARSGRLNAVKKLLKEISQKNKPPDEFCYVNNFKNPEAPILLRFKAGQGSEFKQDIHEYIETLKNEVPQLFESQDFIARKKEIMEAYEKRSRDFFNDLNEKVKKQGFAMISVKAGQADRPELMPIVDDEPMPIHKLEELTQKQRFPEKEYKEISKKHRELKIEIEQLLFEVRGLQKELREKVQEADKQMLRNTGAEYASPLLERYPNEDVHAYLVALQNDLTDNLAVFFTGVDGSQQQAGGNPNQVQLAGDPFMPYQVNLLVDNALQKSPPVIIESYPTYRNLFGSIERVVDKRGVWRTDFTQIKVGSFLKANGGYLVLNLSDILTEPGVWPALKRALRTKKMEIQTFDPSYWFTATGIKPEPIDIDVKVVLLADPRLYQLLLHYDEDVPGIFKVRADFDHVMNRTDDSVRKFCEFIRTVTKEEDLLPFDPGGVAALLEQGVRMSGRKEKLSTSFPQITDLIREADYFATRDKTEVVQGQHVEDAIAARIYRSSLVEEKIQEMIDRGSIMIDTSGAVVGQINGLAVYSTGDGMFGKPSRITATTSMGKSGVINIEREVKMSGPIHNKGVLILGGYLRWKFAQDKPLAICASLAFEQSYSGIDGDSASSTEIYALLSSLAELPIKQHFAVTGSVNQKGEIQAIGGVNAKIEGFYDCCKSSGLTGDQGVLIPAANVGDLMLRQDVVEAVAAEKFHIHAVTTIDEGIEILTGIRAGEVLENGGFPTDTVNFLVDDKLRKMALGLQQFGKEKNESEEA